MSSGSLPLHTYHRAQSIGAGSYGSVIAVYDDEGNEFALKLFDDECDDDDVGMMLGALREISVLRLLRGQNAHPNIVEMHDVQTGFEDEDVGAGTGECLSMAMPLFRSGNLADYMSKLSSKREKVSIAHGILCAVSHLHENSILHRDIKSDNIVLEYSGEDNNATMRPVLIDFSLAKVLEPGLLIPGGDACATEASYDGPTHTPTIGTPTYRSPEVVDQKEYGLPSDMWSVGVVLLELLNGKCLDATKDKSASTQIDQLLEALPQDQPFPNLIRGLLMKDPSRRMTAQQALQSDLFDKFGMKPDERTGRLLQINKAVPFDDDDGSCSTNDEENGFSKKKTKPKLDAKLVKRFKTIQKVCRAMEWTNPMTAQAALSYSIQMTELCDVDDPDEIQALLDCVILAHKFFERHLYDLTELASTGGKMFQNWDQDEYVDNESTLFMMMDFCLYPRQFHPVA